MKNPIAAAEALLKKCSFVTMCTTTYTGYPRPFTIRVQKNVGVKTLYMLSNMERKHYEYLAEYPKAGISFGNSEQDVTLLGKVRIITDPAVKNQLWEKWKNRPATANREDYVDSPKYCVLEFNTVEGKYNYGKEISQKFSF